MVRIIIIGVIVFVCYQIACAFALDENLVHELSCSDLPNLKSIELDKARVPKWFFNETARLYFPLMSKLQAYRFTSDLFQKEPREILDKEVAPCIYNAGNSMHSSDGLKIMLDIKWGELSATYTALWPNAIEGNFYFHVTDEKTYVISLTCYEDGWSSWAAFSDTPELTPVAVFQILMYIQSLGFDPMNALYNDPKNCLK